MASQDALVGERSAELYADHPNTTDPIMMFLAHQIFPDVTLESGHVIPNDRARETFRQHGGVLLRYLSGHGIIDLENMKKTITAQAQEGEQ